MTSFLFPPSVGVRWAGAMLLGVAFSLLFGPLPMRAQDAPPVPPTKATVAIKVDQVGYPQHAPKIALLTSAPSTQSIASGFQLRRSSDGAVVFHGHLPLPMNDADTGDQVQAVDFCSFKKPGNY